MNKTFVIGDIHGSYRALKQVLEKSNFEYENDTLISLGDVADGWSEVPECVDELLKITNLISIRGNHDVWVYDWFEKGLTPLIWTQQGGQATIDAYIRTCKLVEQSHKDFWKNQMDWYIDGENKLFIHGGWYYRDGFPDGAKYPVNAGTIAKECHWDRSLYESAESAHYTKNTFKPLEQFKEVYIGHTAIAKHEPVNVLNLWNLDTGAGWGGKLTIMNINTKEYWQSDFVHTLYPKERGRI